MSKSERTVQITTLTGGTFKEGAQRGQILLLFLACSLLSLADTLVYDNGPFVNRPGEGPGGSDGSVLIAPMGVNGWYSTQNYGARVADDFTIPSGETWDISKIRFFGYQPFLPTNSPIPGMTLEIWQGMPDQLGSSVIWGNTNDNVLIGSGFTGAYRYTDGSPSTVDAIRWLDASVNFTLTSGTYWLDWSVNRDESIVSDVYTVPITVDGERTTGNALCMPLIGQWGPALDIGFDGNNTPQGFPFQVFVPEPSIKELSIVGLLIGITAMIVSRRHKERRSETSK